MFLENDYLQHEYRQKKAYYHFFYHTSSGWPMGDYTDLINADCDQNKVSYRFSQTCV